MTTLALQQSVRKRDFHLEVDVRIPSRGVTGVFGPSGSGKTTLLRAVAGLEAAGAPALTVGMVFQDARLFGHLNVRRNVEYGWRRNGSPAGVVESTVALLGIETLLSRDVASLSGGESQRVAIARALCRQPQLLLLDEPLSSLDQRRKEDLLPYLDRLHRELDIPMLYVSHDIDEISRLCDHIVVLDHGRVVAEGSLREMMSRLDVPILGGSNAGSVIAADAVEYDEVFALTRFTFSGGELWVPGQFETKCARLRIRASDVSLTRQQPSESSIQNVLPVRIAAKSNETAATVLVRLECGDDVLLSQITRRAWQQLDLNVGDAIFAQVKSAIVRH